ncbi:hypothetical protein BATDEDRAFT_34613 [Batrachochytrium dendrobatidis JAM81]|uniref:L-type lectin-like domain-containing protein n=1 Tax=Batrachochytrium dendrobatidis (strain JAM81 / FGSC 10211) TaxID=684364 RepID=F4NZ83_BATDJ|nr:uncharacterized protein BATDEDRAFT_34613 [Batrachochytrium dendrobatidis JAM81]EGF81845.1 hypothetical protein BATDEDRAFT_34613 [Batrachochytrium dendrobatidis JAM81]|eukprot:XP_006677428.1 hypothetical protein BATDEDRAFT_34613 [Batrachochytrium dendrobatidis JAM81]
MLGAVALVALLGVFQPILVAAQSSSNNHVNSSIHTRFDYRRSFKPPYFLQDQSIPYFKTTSDVSHGSDFLRLAMSIPDKHGSIWSSLSNPYKEWQVVLSFFVYGRGSSGSDGLVFWLVDAAPSPPATPDPNNPQPNPPVTSFYGHNSNFKGFALVFDSSDASRQRTNPFIYAILNDGTKHAADFANYMSPQVHVGACFREFRNTAVPVHARLTYMNKTLSLDIDIREEGEEYTNCFSTEMPSMPENAFFGVSASTDSNGFDDHDVVSMEVFEINPPPRQKIFRPNEEADIAKGKKFKMNEDLKKEVEKAEQRVRKVAKAEASKTGKDASTKAAMDLMSIKRVADDQTRIIEMLNSVQQKLSSVPASSGDNKHIPSNVLTEDHQYQFESRISAKFDAIKAEVDSNRNEVRVLSKYVVELKELAHQLLERIDSKLGKTKEMIEQTNANLASSSNDAIEKLTSLQGQNHSSALYYALYIFASLAGIACILLVYSFILKTKERQIKKFI